MHTKSYQMLQIFYQGALESPLEHDCYKGDEGQNCAPNSPEATLKPQQTNRASIFAKVTVILV